MDRFLRSVVDKRDREQNIADDPLADSARERWLDSQTRPLNCRVCGELVINEHIDNPVRTSVCGKCGGRRKQAQLEREDARRARAAAAAAQLLSLAGIQTDLPQGEQVANIGDKTCSEPGCTRKLSRSNIIGKCMEHKGGASAVEGGAAVRKASATDDVRKQFRSLTSGLGIDGDHLIDSFCRGWIARLKSKVEAVPEDDYQTSLERES